MKRPDLVTYTNLLNFTQQAKEMSILKFKHISIIGSYVKYQVDI